MRLLPEDQERNLQVKIYLENNYREHITYATLTELYHVSARKLSSDFKKQFNTTIYDFLIEVRIAKAKDLLETSFKPVKTIARLVGYDESNLYKQFKKLTGMAPQDWRKIQTDQEIKNE